MRDPLSRMGLPNALLSMIMAAGLAAACSPAPPPSPTVIPTQGPPTPTATAIVIEAIQPTSVPPTPTEEGAEPPTAAPAEGAITLENVQELRQYNRMDVSESSIGSAEFAPEGHQVATFGFDKVLRLIDADFLTTKSEMVGHGDYGFDGAWSPDGTRFASGGGFALMIWDMETGTRLSTTQIQARNPYGIAWSPDGDSIAISAPTTSHLEIVSPDGGVIEDVKPGNNALWGLAYAPDGSLAVSTAAGNIVIMDGDTYETLQTVQVGTPAWDIAFSPDGSLMAACLDGGAVGIWEVGSYARKFLVAGHADDCTDGAFTHSGELYFTVGGDGMLIGWNPQTGGQLVQKRVGGFIWGVSISSDDILIATALGDGSMHIFGLQ